MFQTWLSYYSFGKLYSLLSSPLVFLYSIRELYTYSHSTISTLLVSIIFSETLLFLGFFWGAYNYIFGDVSVESIIGPELIEQSVLILIILNAAAISVSTVVFRTNTSISTAILCALLFIIVGSYEQITSLYLLNTAQAGTYFYTLVSIHFFHVFLGVVISLFLVWNNHLLYNMANTYSKLGSTYKLFLSIEDISFFSVVYFHFVEILWFIVALTTHLL